MSQFEFFNRDQKNAILLLEQCLSNLKIGQSEQDILQHLEQQAKSIGFIGFIRRPIVHIDYRISLRWGPSKTRRLQVGSVVQIHIQPYTQDAFGNIGLSFVYKRRAIPIVEKAQDLCLAASTFATGSKKAGEIFVFSQSWCTNHRTELNKESVGHFCFPNTKKGLFGNRWPQSMRALTQMKRFQLQWYNPRALSGVYAIHPDIKQDGRRAGFAELLHIDAGKRTLLGRDSLDEICTFKWDNQI
jgi:hypothetical protein